MANLSVQDSTIKFLQEVEGFAPTAFWDVKQWSIGYGTNLMPNGRAAKQGDTVTKAEAAVMLKRDAPIRAAAVNAYVTSAINQNQFDALVSFVYNLGAGAFAGSTLLKKINLNPLDYQEIEFQFMQWDNAGGMHNDGVENRRKKEIALYKNGAVATNFFFWLILVTVIFLYKKRKNKKS